jgi:adenine-specific DNA-methyltransferase
VARSLEVVTSKRNNALILDFFAGSGTTLHATCLLNSQDGGRRRCVVVTNNELGEKLEKQLLRGGHFPGDPEFEREGICESVTWPRCKYVIAGNRDDGTHLPGKHLDGRELKNGFDENMEYFRLDFVDPTEVALGKAFESILPILWMRAGCIGKRESSRGSTPWFIPKNSPYAVLIREKEFAQFRKELWSRKDIKLVFLITDSEENFRAMTRALDGNYETVQLYKSYLENFRINTRMPTES